MPANTVREQEESDCAAQGFGARGEALLRISGLTVRFGVILALE